MNQEISFGKDFTIQWLDASIHAISSVICYIQITYLQQTNIKPYDTW